MSTGRTPRGPGTLAVRQGGGSAGPNALVMRPTTATARRMEYLAFRVHSESYGIAIAAIHEILKIPPITEVPRAPAHVLGIISVRGTIVTVVDMRRRLRLPVAPALPRSRILLVEWQGDRLGLLVDEVQQVVRLAPQEIEQSPTVPGGTDADLFSGVGRIEGMMVILLHLGVLLEGEGVRAKAPSGGEGI